MIKIVNTGEFGPIYEGILGKEAIDFLLEKRSGEVPKAMNRDGLGYIDFIYGKKGEQRYGLAHIEEYHSEIIPYLVVIIQKRNQPISFTIWVAYDFQPLKRLMLI